MSCFKDQWECGILKYNYLHGYSPSSYLDRCKIISSERFRVPEYIFSEASPLLKYLGPSVGCRHVDIKLSTR